MTSVQYEHSFLAGFFDSETGINFNNYTLSLTLSIQTTDNTNQDVAFDRIDFVFREVLDNAIFIDENEEEVISVLDSIGMNVLTLNKPGPVDNIIQITIVDKLNAITEDVLTIYESQLHSIKGGYIKYNYFVDKRTTGNYISDDKEKWWNKKEPIFVTTTNEECDFKEIHFWDEMNMGWKTEKEEDKTPNIVKMPI